MKEDTKILFAVAGFVVLGAVAIAVVGGMSLDRQSDAEEVATTPPSREIATLPATFERDVPLFDVPLVPEPEEIAEVTEIETVEPAPFTVQSGEDYIARGLETYRAREFDKASAYFRAAAEERPDRAWTHYMLGLALWKDGRYEEAAVEMERSAELDGGSVKTFVNLSRIQNDRGDPEAALQAADAALAFDPESADALFVQGRSLAGLGSHDEAIAAFDRAIEKEPDHAFAHNLLGLTLLETGEVDSALEAFRIAAEVKPDVAYIQNNLGMALERAGDPAEAVEVYRVAVGLDPDHEKAAANLARLEPTVVEIDVVESVIAEDSVAEAMEIAEAAPTETEVPTP
jgi:tetratricopeptide (TPR) repeat protein